MKTILSLAAAAFALAAFAPTADAGYYKNVLCGYDACGRPVYRCVYVRTYSDYCAPRSCSPHYSSPRYHHNHSSYNRPSYSRRSYGYRPSYSR
jgi:hypothetical protein